MQLERFEFGSNKTGERSCNGLIDWFCGCGFRFVSHFARSIELRWRDYPQYTATL